MNKFLILITAFLCIYQVSTAQTEKGNQTVGFNVGFSSSKYSDDTFDNQNIGSTYSNVKNTGFLLGPLYSYFIADNVDLGASFSLSSFTNSRTYTNFDNKNSSHNKNYEAIVYVRKYFLHANKIGIRTGPYAGYTWSDQGFSYIEGQSSGGSIYRSHGYEAGAKLEAVYFPSKSIGISAMIANLQYEHFSGKNLSGSTVENTNGSNVNFNFINNGLSLSLFYVFGK